MFRFSVLIKLAITALVLYGVWGVGSAYLRYYQFEDALQELAQFGDQRTDKVLCQQAMDHAANLDVPVAADAIEIRRGSNPSFNCETGYQGGVAAPHAGSAKIFIDARYTDQLQILPGYRYPWEFRPGVSAWVRP